MFARAPASPAGRVARVLTTSAQRPLRRPPPHLLPRLPSCVAASRAYSYPKEGLFQPDSPPREIPGFGPAPPMGQSQYRPSPPTPPPHMQPPTPQGYAPTNPTIPVINGAAGASRGWRRRLWLLFVASSMSYALAVGYLNGKSFLQAAPTPEPGSEEDAEELDTLFAELGECKIIEGMRGLADLGAFTISFPDKNVPAGERGSRLATGALAGSRGVAARMDFTTAAGDACISFVNFGAATCGWPGAVHGGAITTIFDELLGRLAGRGAGGDGGGGAAAPGRVRVDFAAKVEPGQWYMMLGRMAGPTPTSDASDADEELYAHGWLYCVDVDMTHETIMSTDPGTTELHVHASARAVYPRTIQSHPHTYDEGPYDEEP